MLTDAELFRGYLKTGDRASLDDLFARHYPAVFHIVLKLVHNQADANDLTQTSFVKAIESARAGHSPHNLRPWLLSIAINAVRQWKRGESRRRRGNWLLEACRRDPGNRTPDEDAERKEFERVLEKVLDSLPEEMAEPLVLHYYENLSYAEVGEVLGLSKTTVQFRLECAREKLRERFTSEGLASLFMIYFPTGRPSTPLLVGFALMNVKKALFTLLVLLATAVAGRRIWTAAMPGSSPGANRNHPSLSGREHQKHPENDSERAKVPGIFGTVFDQRTNLPLADALVSAYDLETATTLETQSDERGAYRVPCDNARGTWHLKFSRRGYASATARGVRSSLEPCDALLAQGGAIKGRVVGAGGTAGVAARILAVPKLFIRDDDFDLSRVLYQQVLPREGVTEESQTVYEPDGRFEIQHLTAGLYILIVIPVGSPPFAYPDDQRYCGPVGIDVREGAVRETVVPVPESATVLLRVTDATTHEAIPGAVVDYECTIDFTHLPVPEYRRTTNAAGECLLPAWLGEHGSFLESEIFVRREGYGTAHADLGLNKGSIVEVKLGKPGRIEGHVRGPGGKPLQGCGVYFEGPNGVVLGHAFTNAEGFYRTGELPAPWDLNVYVVDPGLSRPRTMRPVLLRPGETQVVDFGGATLAGISGTVRQKGQPCARSMVCIQAPEIGLFLTVLYTDDQGNFNIEGLVPGPYELFVQAKTPTPGSLSFRRHLTLAEGERKEFNFDVGARSIRGTLVDARTLAPLDLEEEVTVVARSAGSVDPAVSTRTAKDGSFELLLIDSPGLYEVVIGDDERYYAADRVLADLSQETALDGLRLPVYRDSTNRTIRIHLKDQESGEPLSKGSYHYGYRSGGVTPSLEGDGCLVGTLRVGAWYLLVEADEYLPARLNLEVRPQDLEIERTLEFRKSDAVRVTSVDPSGPAERAGLRQNDVVLACNGLRVLNVAALTSIRKSLPVAQSVTLSVRRGAATLDIVVSEPDLGMNGENGLADGDTRR